MNLEQNVYVAHLNTVRKSWVNKTPDNIKEMFRAMPQAERFEHYKRIDEAVSAMHTGLIYDAREAGVKVTESKNKELLDNAADRIVELLINGTFA
ncbi:MAG: RNA polymerase binding protein [Enterobacter phage ENC7]|nr:MAG: RNA polymerase binding protein [Enterobacter phage ENC7]UIW11885.1 MAG: RNA polymerase binding protein [Enterobacter phage ENC25]UIW12143.1 MAG: RNA polymerase binding protein [Enterobacter phage ENC22]UIW12238.1 MAG: RNA polymerase binding protein [Enterobacter phage ENC20]